MANGLLQDWTSISGVGSTPVTQTAASWADLQEFANVTFWLEVRDLTSDNNTPITLAYQTAPTEDETFFVSMATVSLTPGPTYNASAATPIVTKIRLGDNPAVALARFVRWSLTCGVGGANYSISFRIFFTAADGVEGPRGIPGDTSGLRLTLTSGTPVTTTDVTGTTLYFTPFKHAQIVLFDGTGWTAYTTNEISLAGGWAQVKIYDVFAYYNATTGLVALELSNTWTNSTTRADAVARRNGVLVKTADPTRRLVGTVATDGSGNLVDTATTRWVWNASNRIDRPMVKTEATGAWAYALSAWRAANNNSANAISYVDGGGEDVVSATALGASKSSGAATAAFVGIGLDTTSANSALLRGSDSAASTVASLQCSAFYQGYPGIGSHVLYWVERAFTPTSVTFLGAPGLDYQFGIMGTVKA